jgi:hypothetical protein
MAKKKCQTGGEIGMKVKGMNRRGPKVVKTKYKSGDSDVKTTDRYMPKKNKVVSKKTTTTPRGSEFTKTKSKTVKKYS